MTIRLCELLFEPWFVSSSPAIHNDEQPSCLPLIPFTIYTQFLLTLANFDLDSSKSYLTYLNNLCSVLGRALGTDHEWTGFVVHGLKQAKSLLCSFYKIHVTEEAHKSCWYCEPFLLASVFWRFWSRADKLAVKACSYDLLALRMETGEMHWEDEEDDEKLPSASLVSTQTAGDTVTSVRPPPWTPAPSSTSSWAHSRHSSQRVGLLSPLDPPIAVAVEKTLRASSKLPSIHSRWAYSRHSTSDERLWGSLSSCLATRLLLFPWERRRFLLLLCRQRKT